MPLHTKKITLWQARTGGGGAFGTRPPPLGKVRQSSQVQAKQNFQYSSDEKKKFVVMKLGLIVLLISTRAGAGAGTGVVFFFKDRSRSRRK